MPQTESLKSQHKLLFKEDLVLLNIVGEVDLPPLHSTNNVFHDLMSCIIEQQIHYRSSKYIFQHLMAEAGLEELNVANFHLLEPCLSNVRLSAAKYEAIAQTVDFFQRNNLPWQELSDEEVRIALANIRGIGRWTVDMILLYTLRRPDIFPPDDYHLGQIMPKLYGLASEQKLSEKMLAIADRWAGHRSLAVLYLLAWKNQNLKKESGKKSHPKNFI